MMSSFIELTGQQFGRWTVLGRDSENSHGAARWICRCDCGREKSVIGRSLRLGQSESCGCLRGQLLAEKKVTHGCAREGSNHPVYGAWRSMKERCTDPNHPAWKNYGGRGITVCAEWMHDFAAFYAAIGDRPGAQYSLDRIDNEKGYSPGNIKWSTRSEQARNRRPRTPRPLPSHCPKGHEMTPENTHICPKTGRRRCRRCRADWANDLRARKKDTP